jgi:hypothetical protein
MGRKCQSENRDKHEGYFERCVSFQFFFLQTERFCKWNSFRHQWWRKCFCLVGPPLERPTTGAVWLRKQAHFPRRRVWKKHRFFLNIYCCTFLEAFSVHEHFFFMQTNKEESNTLTEETSLKTNPMDLHGLLQGQLVFVLWTAELRVS